MLQKIIGAIKKQKQRKVVSCMFEQDGKLGNLRKVLRGYGQSCAVNINYSNGPTSEQTTPPRQCIIVLGLSEWLCHKHWL